MRIRNPIQISDGKIRVLIDPEYSLRTLGVMDTEKYYHRKSMVVYSHGKAKRIKKGTPKSRMACAIIDLRYQFSPVCCDTTDYDPEENPAVGMLEGSNSVKDMIYRWNFVHRHGFPSEVHGSSRGQSARAMDIFNHPLSYMLMCNEHHEEYDRENGEWKNPKNREKYQGDS